MADLHHGSPSTQPLPGSWWGPGGAGRPSTPAVENPRFRQSDTAAEKAYAHPVGYRALAYFVLAEKFVVAMAEPGAPKPSYAHQEGAGKLSSRIEPRAAAQPPAVARTAPSRNPKAPLPPRVSQADAAEAVKAFSSGVIDTIEPESVHTKVASPTNAPPALPSRPASAEAESVGGMPKEFEKALEQLQRRREASSGVVPPPPTSSMRAVDFESALAQLQRQRETGAPAPPPPPSSRKSLSGVSPSDHLSDASRPKMASIPSVKDLGKDLKPLVSPSPSERPPAPQPGVNSITAPLASMGLKPGGSSLAPSRAPSPLAVVSGASLRLSMPDKTSPMAQRPLPPATAESSPLALPLPTPSSRSVPPAPLSSRPPAGRTPSPAAGGSTSPYERAFRQWSSPSIVPLDDPSSSEPVTYQVYTAEDVARGRGPMRSMAAVPVRPKESLAKRIGLAAIGIVVVALTAAAVIAVSTEEPKRSTTSASTASAASTEEPAEAPPDEPAPIPSVITIGDPIDDVDEPEPAPKAASPTPKAASPAPKAASPTPTPSTPAATNTPSPKPKAKAGAPAPPASLKAIAPPPNPYGN